MPQGYYTLEEAARLLMMSEDELKLMARRGQIRFFQDRGTLRFRIQDVQELARQRGLGSDPELPLGEASKSRPSDSPVPRRPGSKEAVDAGALAEIGGSSLPPTPQPGSDSDVRLVEDADFTLEVGSQVKLTSPAPGPRTPSPSSRSGPASSPPHSKVAPPASGTASAPPSSVSKSSQGEAEMLLVPPDSDSDVRLVPPQERAEVPLGEAQPLGATDSDIRLEPLVPLAPSPEEGMLTEEIDLDEELRRQAAATPPASPQAAATPPASPPKSKAVEASPRALVRGPSTPSQASKSAAAPSASAPAAPAPTTEDSSSDFDLTPAGQSSSPLELSSGEIPLVAEDKVPLGDSPAAASASGINLDRPVDSGIPLDKTEPGSDEIEYELTLDEPSSPTEQLPGSSSEFELTLESSEKPSADAGSDSEFELTLAVDQPASPEATSDPSSSEFELTLEPTGSSPLAADSGAAPASAPSSDSDSEFELNVDESLGSSGVLEMGEEGADIFEEPAAGEGESGSLALPLEEGSDLESSEFEVVDDAVAEGEESTSQAVPVDEGLEELETGEEVTAVREEEEEEKAAPPEPVLVTTAPWGPLPTIFLLPSVIVLFLVGLMGFELLQGLSGYHSPGLVTKAITNLIMPK